MRAFRSALLAAPIVALTIGALAAPAAAANPRLAIVQGMPGKVVDVCIGSTEVRSGLRYGRWVERSVAPGTRTLRFRQAAPGTCTGNVLAQRSLTLAADDDLTVVGNSRSPKVVVFDNLLPPAPVGPIDWLGLRHAADLGDVVMTVLAGGVVTPAAPAEFEEGDGWRVSFGSGASVPLTFAAFLPGGVEPFVGPRQYLTYSGRRHEIILVGTKPRNARFVAVVRSTIAP